MSLDGFGTPRIEGSRRDATAKGPGVSATPLVCVVEDDPSVRAATGSLMRSLGYEVLLFDSAEAYLSRQSGRPHCLVCDVQMPGMSGIDLYENLVTCGRAVPTVFITGHAKTAVEQRIGDAARIVVKPFDGSELVAQIERALAEIAE